MKKDVIIIGAGASGLVCAAVAARRKRSVLVLEHMKRCAGKIRVSGGGRCNFTNLHAGPENYCSENSHFSRSALSQFRPSDFIALLEQHGIRYREKEDGQLFCEKSSEEIIGMLQQECTGAGAEILLPAHILCVDRKHGFEVLTDRGRFTADSLVVATGGLSYPTLGATGLGYAIAKKFGIGVTSLRPGLVPFEFRQADLRVFGQLSGLSLTATIVCGKRSFTGSILFTHRGISGPAVLQSSLYWNKGESIVIDLLPGTDLREYVIARRSSAMTVANALAEFLPRRFIRTLLEPQMAAKPLSQLSNKELQTLSERVHRWRLEPKDTEGYQKAEVTLGGIDTQELSSKTMEAKKVPGLFFAGEVIDVTGHLGGFNLQWAWSSGYVAGSYA
ncbi:MAG: BaiN/RdsA family NAD(P)/FAD-dependent oxidoreductase [Thermodesulfovibrionales bacterium]